MTQQHGDQDIDVQFILGVIAGEGTFYVALQHREDSEWNVSAGPEFTVKMDERDDDLVRRMRSSLGLGSYNTVERPNRTMVQWRISAMDEMLDLVSIIEQNKQFFRYTDKYESYKKWKQAVEIVCSRDNYQFERSEVIRCIELAKRMNKTGSHNKLTESDWKERVADD